MTRIFLRILNAPILILLCIIGVALQTSLFRFYPLNYLQPDIILLGVIWFSIYRNFTEGGCLTLILADIAEIHSSTPQGVFLICYIAVNLLVRALSHWLVMRDLTSIVILTLGMSIFWKLSCLFVLYLFGLGPNQWKHTAALLLPGSIMAGVLSIWVYRGLEWFDRITYKDIHSKKFLEEEFELEGEGL